MDKLNSYGEKLYDKICGSVDNLEKRGKDKITLEEVEMRINFLKSYKQEWNDIEKLFLEHWKAGENIYSSLEECDADEAFIHAMCKLQEYHAILSKERNRPYESIPIDASIPRSQQCQDNDSKEGMQDGHQEPTANENTSVAKLVALLHDSLKIQAQQATNMEILIKQVQKLQAAETEKMLAFDSKHAATGVTE